MRLLTLILVSCLLAFEGTTSLYAAIVIDGYTHATNDRFTDSPTFVLNGSDLSGVGQDASGRWATAISRNVIISANHFQPSGTVFFFPDNNPNSIPVQRTIVSGTKVGATDLWVGVLNQNLPGSISEFAFATTPLSGTPPNGNNFFLENAGIYQGLNSFMFGRSPFDETINGDARFAFNDQAVGRNLISGYVENIPFTDADNDSLLMIRDALGSPDHVLFEALFQGGDSGGPTFVEQNGSLVLLGTNAFIADDSSFSGINYTGNQASFITNFININAVPEPNGILLLAFGLLFRVRRRK
ncbi:MAG: PEP-CTERM sorting domain-containing protein [Planctomycetales bacterium]|nr:PEP-CTERM sorting domain-containing protein [Planctomycetales bacterium]